MIKAEAIKILEDAPINDESMSCGYFLVYDLDKELWYGAYDSDKGSVWYWWDNERFNMVSRLSFNYPKNSISVEGLEEIINQSPIEQEGK